MFKITNYFKYFTLAFIISLFLPSFVFAEVLIYSCEPVAVNKLNGSSQYIDSSHLYFNSDEAKNDSVNLEIDFVKQSMFVNKETPLLILPNQSNNKSLVEGYGMSTKNGANMYLSFDKNKEILYFTTNLVDKDGNFINYSFGYFCYKNKK